MEASTPAGRPDTEIPNGALSAAGNELVSAVSQYHEALEDLQMRLDQSGILKPEMPTPEAPGNISAVPSLDASSSLADLLGSQASRVRSGTAQLRRLTERIDR